MRLGSGERRLVAEVGTLSGIGKALFGIEIVLLLSAGYLFVQEAFRSPMAGPDPNAVPRLVGAFSVVILLVVTELLRRLTGVVHEMALELRHVLHQGLDHQKAPPPDKPLRKQAAPPKPKAPSDGPGAAGASAAAISDPEDVAEGPAPDETSASGTSAPAEPPKEDKPLDA